MLIYMIVAFIVSLIFTFTLMPKVLSFCKKKHLYDLPNSRKVHHCAVPRLGGVLFMPAMLVGMIAAVTSYLFFSEGSKVMQLSSFVLVAGVLIIYIIGVFDDIVGVKAKRKFLIQAIAACFFPACGLYINNLYGLFGIYAIPQVVSYLLTVFLVLVIVNSINLIDGIDGLASGLCLIIFGVFAWLFWKINTPVYSIMSCALMGTVAAFFYYNVFGSIQKGTKTFMGDTGSLILGYSIAYLSLKYAMNNPKVLPYRGDALLWSYTILIIPTFDLVRVAIWRLIRHRPMFSPDKTHIHHLVMKAGFTMHQALVIILSLFVFFCVLNAFLYSEAVSPTVILLVDIVAYAAFFVLLHFVSSPSIASKPVAASRLKQQEK